MPDDAAKTTFRALEMQKEAIEREFGEPLDWQELPGKKASRIALYRSDTDPSDEKLREEQHRWMLEKMDAFKRMFANRVKLLPAARLAESDEDEE